ncbi:MAG: 3-phosphoshikimate 1-carboxyvinyltransferase [Candidatus Symbiothrix sp.]|jgi:3-phosphoshikimate 1-carboxyvinyltransferase|nr:3-phosphoshikimate 1-carboxyvinyltransferase [Candidatus Symbiothrix sp.]
MVYSIQKPPVVQASVRLPASKSISNRALILNVLSSNPCPVDNLSDSDDTQVLLKALQSSVPDLNIGAAGTSMRFLTAYLSQLDGEWRITGTERMKNRPIRVLVDALRELGGDIVYPEKEGFPPLLIRGKKLKGGDISLQGNVSSQYISALMMIAPRMENGLSLHLEGGIISRPYIEMTVRLMEAFGIRVVWEGQTIRIRPQVGLARPFKVESDWSAASYWYEIIALAGENSSVELSGLEKDSIQGDSKGKMLFEKIGVQTVHTENGVILSKSSVPYPENTALLYDFVNEPDLAQTFVVTCCLRDIPFRFSGLQSLRIKETDRIAALQTEMQKLGYVIREKGNSVLEWTGERLPPAIHPVISTYEDHRMAMAFAPACLKTGSVKISEPGVVSKSYPRFWDDLKQAGFTVMESK